MNVEITKWTFRMRRKSPILKNHPSHSIMDLIAPTMYMHLCGVGMAATGGGGMDHCLRRCRHYQEEKPICKAEIKLMPKFKLFHTPTRYRKGDWIECEVKREERMPN